jgi:hypothetical protein
VRRHSRYSAGRRLAEREAGYSRVGFYRYSKRRFNGDFANLIAVWHNLSPKAITTKSGRPDFPD